MDARIPNPESLALNAVAPDLHELYLASLGGDGVLPQGGLSVGIVRDFGSVERWRSDFKAHATASATRPGWALLSWSARENRLFNHAAADLAQVPAGSSPILALELNAPGPGVDEFLGSIDWTRTAERYVAAVHASTVHLETAETGTAVRIDVRRKGAFDAAADMIAGAVWRDPERVDEWAAEFAGKEVVVYCVFGHEVGQSTAARLKDSGVAARYLLGGMKDWKDAGLPVQPK